MNEQTIISFNEKAREIIEERKAKKERELSISIQKFYRLVENESLFLEHCYEAVLNKLNKEFEDMEFDDFLFIELFLYNYRSYIINIYLKYTKNLNNNDFVDAVDEVYKEVSSENMHYVHLNYL